MVTVPNADSVLVTWIMMLTNKYNNKIAESKVVSISINYKLRVTGL